MFGGKIVVVFFIIFVIVFAEEDGGSSSTKLNGEELKEAEKLLVQSLSKFAAGYGPFYKYIFSLHFNLKLFLYILCDYRIGEMHFVTKEETVGKVFKYKTDLIDNNSNLKKCEVQIWTRPDSETGVEVTFKCDGPVVAHA